MANKKTHDAVHVEKYTDRNGEEKKRYTNMGALFERDDGSRYMKIDTIPVGFNGWVAFYEPRERSEQVPRPQSQSPQRGETRSSGGSVGDFEDDSIPF